MRADSGHQIAVPAKASLWWAAKWAALALCGAFALMVLGALTGSNLVSLAALTFPFAVWVGVIAKGQKLGKTGYVLEAPMDYASGVGRFSEMLDEVHSRRLNDERK